MSTAPSLVVIVPGHLDTVSGGYEYDRRMVAGLRSRRWSVEVRELGGSFPHPDRATVARASRVLSEIPARATVLIDGLALGALPAEVEREAARLRLVALVHHPLAAESGLDSKTAARLEQDERRALKTARSVIVTSRATASALSAYDIDPARISVVEPGTDRAPLARGSGGPSVGLLCIAAVIPRKGYDLLVRALALVRERNWRLTCVGSLDRDPVTAGRLRALVLTEGLTDRVVFAGEANRAAVDAHCDRADVFVMPTLHEGYGMAVAEALARGLPVIGTATGAIPELLGDGFPRGMGYERGPVELSAGLLVPPDDVESLARALAAVLDDVPLRARLAQGAQRVRDRLPSWEEAADKLADVIERVARDR
jgi:glycosyltransferase involved in cell wall biosynthesis